MAVRLLVVIASTRPGRVGPAVAEWFCGAADEHGAFDVEVADLAAVGLPFLDEPAHPRRRAYRHAHTRAWSACVEPADALAFVMPEYNHGVNAPLKNALDFLWWEWHRKPVGLVSYGGVSAGTRAISQLEPTLVALGMTPTTTAVTIPFVRQFVGEDGRMHPNEILRDAAAAMCDELVEAAHHLAPLRAAVLARHG